MKFITDVWEAIVSIIRESGLLALAIVLYGALIVFFVNKNVIAGVLVMAIIAIILILDSDW